MKTMEQIMALEFSASIFEKLDSTEIQYVKDAMQEYAQQIASLAWDAGASFGVDDVWCSERGQRNQQPTKEQFLNSIFNNHV